MYRQKYLIITTVLSILFISTLCTLFHRVIINPWTGDVTHKYGCLFYSWEENNRNWLVRSVMPNQPPQKTHRWLVHEWEVSFSLTEILGHTDGEALWQNLNRLGKFFSQGLITYPEYARIITRYKTLLTNDEGGALNFLVEEVQELKEKQLEQSIYGRR